MSTRNFIPEKDADFNLWVINFFLYLLGKYTVFNIPENAIEALQFLKSDWDTKYARAEAPATRTKATIREKTAARNTLEKAVRAFLLEYVTYNHLVGDADRDNMGLPIHKTTRTRHTTVTDLLELILESRVIRRLIGHYRVAGSTSDAKPEYIQGAEIRWAFLEHSPESVDELIHSIFDTRSPFTVEFEEKDRGRRVWFCARWENMTGEKGPWSEMVMAIVP
ncbi:MAG: hypothetical protein LBC40_04470 [Dysgonamonadaceae bacterium]|jgi:hypothetical protein|nr:hypothetical protein [Dysgonamonadaceae bacterium]